MATGHSRSAGRAHKERVRGLEEDVHGIADRALGRISTTDVSELNEALADISRAAFEDVDLLKGLSLLAPVSMEAGYEYNRSQIEFETLHMLMTEILNRAEAVGAESDMDLREIYLAIEKTRFCSVLVGDFVVPLVAVSFDLDSPVQISDGTWIEPLSESDHRVRALPWIRDGPVDPYVAASATHAVVLKQVTFPNVVHALRHDKSLPEGVSVDAADAMAEALHIVSGASTGYAQVLVRPQGWSAGWVLDLPPLWTCWTGRAYPEELNAREWSKTMSPVSPDNLDAAIQVSKGLKEAPRNVKIAARRCRKTTFRDDSEDVVLDLAIGIEALLGNEPDSLTHRMAQRAAIVLAEKVPPENTYKLVKGFYAIRSQIAHGASPKRWTVKLGNEEHDVIEVGDYLLRELLLNRLLAKRPWTAESLDSRMLAAFEGSVSARTVRDENPGGGAF
ncbi:hypothetical protein GS937_01650 [Rhodococcus hoagii]|nr:hypothetical protein [Prescottella equi]